MTNITEIAPDVYRLSIFNEAIGLQFNHFLIKDDEPLLYHTGYKSSFAELNEAVQRLLTPKEIRLSRSRRSRTTSRTMNAPARFSARAPI